MYAFYSPIPEIEYRDGRKCHIFRCTAQANVTRCGHRIVRYLDTKDAQSTSNLRKHARKCWGEDVIKEADEAGTLDAARTLLRKDAGSDKRNGSITSHFARQGKGRVTYSHRQHTKQESRCVELMLDCRKLKTICYCQGPWLQLLDEDRSTELLRS